VKDGDIDKILKRAADAQYIVDDTLRSRIAESLRPSLCPVHPLPPRWLLTLSLLSISLLVALAGAARAGFGGFAKMDLLQVLLIFPALGILAWLLSEELVNQSIPGSRHRFSPGRLLAATCVVLLVVFALAFQDYQTQHFLAAGILCLVTGVAHAIPAGILCWLILRRGFAVNSVVAGLVGGAVAGIAGITLLEFHCVNFQAFHVLVWHTAVVPVSALLGAAIVYLTRSFRPD